ncbi:hypothetical protein SAY86_002375 [Trapa natans]|uniref:Uncharacterized protein n=1 Tax=Trapa natans TaxID=22666 RepID=A0AAN7R399_TRANT|nr:hypothetical protein SAY86_002375 [Trapa natans]
MEAELEEGCTTPRSQIRGAPAACPPPPRKKPPPPYGKLGEHGNQRELQQKKGFFQPPDLELIFTIKPRREALC